MHSRDIQNSLMHSDVIFITGSEKKREGVKLLQNRVTSFMDCPNVASNQLRLNEKKCLVLSSTLNRR